MQRYLFFVNLPYSFEILRPLQEEIWRRGDDAAWFLNGIGPEYVREGERLLEDVDTVRAYDPAAAFVPGNWVPDFFPGAKVQVFHGLANDATGKKGHYRIRELFDLYCTHAPETTRIFGELAGRHGTFHVAETGWPKLDPLFGPRRSGGLRSQLGTDLPVVFFASTFSPSLTAAPTIFETIAGLVARRRWFWLLTLHPKTDPEIVRRYRSLEGPNVRFIDSGTGVLPLLETGDVMLCDTSSIALEFMLLDKPIVTFRTKVPGPQVLDVTSPAEIEPALERALARPPELLSAARTYIDALHPYRDGRSSSRVLDATHEFIRDHAASLRPKPSNLFRKLKIRRRMGYYRFR